METPARILIIRLTAIGDVVLTLPAVSVLRQNFPTAKITFLTTKDNRKEMLDCMVWHLPIYDSGFEILDVFLHLYVL